jgi:hypothetical protein
MEGSDQALNNVLSCHLPGGTGDHHEKLVMTAGDRIKILIEHCPHMSLIVLPLNQPVHDVVC